MFRSYADLAGRIPERVQPAKRIRVCKDDRCVLLEESLAAVQHPPGGGEVFNNVTRDDDIELVLDPNFF